MRRLGFIFICALVVTPACTGGGTRLDPDTAGKALFEKNCASCHKDGGNVVNPQKTLSRYDRAANGITTADDVIKVMRNPGPGMPTFGPDVLTDDEARAVAEFVVRNY